MKNRTWISFSAYSQGLDLRELIEPWGISSIWGISSMWGLGEEVQCTGGARGMFYILLKNGVSYQHDGNMVVAKGFCRTENMRN